MSPVCEMELINAGRLLILPTPEDDIEDRCDDEDDDDK